MDKTIFEQWLEEIFKSDPYYKKQIVCNYYDDCKVCPLYGICTKNDDEILQFLDYSYAKYNGK